MRYGVLLAVILVGVPGPVAANDDPFFRSWFGYCMPGVPGACAGASLRLEYLGAMSLGNFSSTRATVRFTNLQGSTGEIGTDPFAMRAFNFDGMSWSEFFLPTVGLLSPPFATGDGAPWTTESVVFPYTAGGGAPTFSLFGQNGSRLFGCDVIANPNTHDGAVCGGMQEYTVVVPGRLEFTSGSTLRLRGLLGGDYSMQRECIVGRTCVGVPEPGSWLLLLTGALGLGIVAGRRRYASSRTLPPSTTTRSSKQTVGA